MNTPLPQDAVPVTPVTNSRKVSKATGHGLIALGMALLAAFTAAGPELTRAYPELKWLPGAVAAAGAFYLAVKAMRDPVVAANYSPPGEPAEATRGIAEEAARKDEPV